MISDSNYEAHKDEVELLTNILFEQLTIKEESPQYILEVKIVPDVVEEPKLNFLVRFVLPGKYPDVSPIFEVNDLSNYLPSSRIKSLYEEIKTFVQENIGMPMIYQIYEMVKDFANEQEEIMQQEHVSKTLIEEEKLKKYNEKISNVDSHLIENRTFTPVTKENFEIWFKKFYADSNKGKEKKLEQEARQSGREFFMKLKASDLFEQSDEEEEETSGTVGIVGTVAVTTSNEQKEETPTYFDADAFGDDIDDIDFDQDYIEDN